MKRGVASSAAVLGSALSAQTVQTIPPAVGQALANAALAQSATAQLPIAAVLHFMSVKLGTQLTAAAIIAGLLIVTGTGVIVHEVRAVRHLSSESFAGENGLKAEAALLNELRGRAEAGEEASRSFAERGWAGSGGAGGDGRRKQSRQYAGFCDPGQPR